MTSELAVQGDGRQVITVRTDWSEVAADYDDLFVRYARLPLPGFRPGRAPSAVIERHFRQQIRDDFTSRCALRLAREALREKDLRPAGPIVVVEIQLEPRREFSFRAEFVPSPVFELPDYDAATLTRETDDERRDELGEWLLSRTPGDAPAALVRQECDRNGQDDAEPGSEAWVAAARRVKLAAILEQIAATEGIETDSRDVDARIEKVAAESGLGPEELRRKLERGDGIASLRSLLLAEQSLNYLIERAGRADARAEEERRLPARPTVQRRGKTKPARNRNQKSPGNERRRP